MLYAITHYENNHKIYIIMDTFHESLHDYCSNYNGALSQFDINEVELHDKYDIHSGSIFCKLTPEAQEFFTKATIAYKKEELRQKSIREFVKYNKNRTHDYLQNLAEIESFNFVHFAIDSFVLNSMANRAGKTLEKLTEELLKKLYTHKNIILNFEHNIEAFSSELESMDFDSLYNLNIEQKIIDILYKDMEVEITPLIITDTISNKVNYLYQGLCEIADNMPVTNSVKNSAKVTVENSINAEDKIKSGIKKLSKKLNI